MMGRALTVSLVVMVLLSSCGCELDRASSTGQQVVVMTYNVQNLFDATVQGNEYAEYTPEKGWTGIRYQQRLDNVSRAITQGHGVVPDIVVLQEIEHAGVLEDLVRDKLEPRGFRWFAATDDAASPIQTGVVSRYPIEQVRIHGIASMRSVLEIQLRIAGEPLVLFALHAKSQREGEEQTEWQRIELTKVLAAITSPLIEEYPSLPVLIAGDFNESADIFFRTGGKTQTALIPSHAWMAEEWSTKGSLLISGGIPRAGSWHSWWLDNEALLQAKAEGSYWYEGVWETFDQILLSFGLFDQMGWEYAGAQVAVTKELRDEKGRPFSWNVRTGDGYSDHFPVYVVLNHR